MPLLNVPHLLLQQTSVPDRLLYIAVKRALAFSTPDLKLVVDARGGRAPYRRLFPNAQRYLVFDVAALPSNDFIASVSAIPIKDSIVDAAICTEVIEHVAETDNVLRELNRILKNPAAISS